MSVRCPNCHCYKTRLSGGRGLLFELGRSVGAPVALLGALGMVAGAVLIPIDRLLLPLALGGIIGGLQMIAIGLIPFALARLGSRHCRYCHICGYCWRDEA
jgi:hypothetical protein